MLRVEDYPVTPRFVHEVAALSATVMICVAVAVTIWNMRGRADPICW